MDIENLEDEVVEEFDLFLEIPATKTYIVNQMTTPNWIKESDYLKIQEIRRKPIQHALEIDMKINTQKKGLKNVVQSSEVSIKDLHYNQDESKKPYDNSTFTLKSHCVNTRAGTFTIEKIGEKIVLKPVERILQMRRQIEDAGNYSLEEAQNKGRRGDQKKQIESLMRTFDFQEELKDLEKYKTYNLIQNQ